MLDRRASPRSKSFLQGRIYFNNRLSSVDCIIRDITETGARLKFGEPITVPETFELNIPNKQETLRAHLVWHHGTEIGIAFDIDRQAGPAGIDAALVSKLAERVNRLEREVAALKRKADDSNSFD